jgi:recombination protein RecA
MGRKKKVEKEETKQSQASLLAELRKSGFPIKYASEIEQAPRLKTGLFALDYVLDGGIPQNEGGYKVEFFGRESSAKSSFSLKVIAKFQEQKKKCLYVDAEESFDGAWASILGVDIDKLVIAQPESLEQAGDLMVKAVPSFDLIVLDSIPALVPNRELDGSLDDQTMGLQARIFAQMCRLLNKELATKMTTLIFINQIREKIGGYGNPETTPGGRALRHFYNARVQFKTTQFIEVGTKENKERIGFTSALTCPKNKKGKPYRTAATDFYYDGFIDNKKTLLYAGIKYGIIQQGGPYFTYNDIKKQGSKAFCDELDAETWNKIEEEIWERLK